MEVDIALPPENLSHKPVFFDFEREVFMSKPLEFQIVGATLKALAILTDY